ncbi:MAG: hypothetical protein LBK22_03830 [Tannerella sp.]|jgi:hypothetical protein|nr:hypothetical protein [Tannerella sp.]
MIFKLSNKFDAERAKAYLSKLIARGGTAELTEKRPVRNLDQNALFHVWIQVFADHAGYESRADCKRDVKRVILGQREYVNRLTGEIEKEDYETHLMDTKQMSGLMDRFKAWALSGHGCYLPYYGDIGYEEMMSEYYKQ